MHRPDVSVSSPSGPWPVAELKKPFAVLLDTRDPEWADGVLLAQKIAELFDLGCRYYVCFGPQSELVHDQIDDVILNKICEEDALTTFHEEETAEDVANFFKVVAMSGMARGLLLVNNRSDWLAKL